MKIDLDNFPDEILARISDGEKVYCLLEQMVAELKALRDVEIVAGRLAKYIEDEDDYRELQEVLNIAEEARRG